MIATLGRTPGDDEILALAVSGGPDSMAMLSLAQAARPGRIAAATFDHRLRAASAGEAAMVADWCADHDIPHAILTPATPLAMANVQATARAARYEALTAWATNIGATMLATAHHADDQAETFLMRANRGCGPAGLAGIRARRPLAPGVELVRPLVGWRRADLATIAAGMPTVDDPSNRDTRFDRARMRHWLAGQELLDPARLARTATYVAEAQADLVALSDWFWLSRRRPGADMAIDVAGLPRVLCRMLARRAVAQVRHDHALATPLFTDSSNVEPLIDALSAGKSATQGAVMATAKGMIWHFRPAPPRKGA
nr:tRNA lysidine(34) synthetase TilS [Sphingomonas sp. BT553]